MIDAAEAFVAGLFTPEMAPFWGVVLIFTIIGQFTSVSVFTRERAYATGAYAKGKFQWFWWWGRESLSLHPIAAGALLGTVMEYGESTQDAVQHFATAGAVSLFGWMVIKAVLKKRGLHITLPGRGSCELQ